MGSIVVVVGKKRVRFDGHLQVIDSSSSSMNMGKMLIVKDMKDGKHIGVFQIWDYWRKLPSKSEKRTKSFSFDMTCPKCDKMVKIFVEPAYARLTITPHGCGIKLSRDWLETILEHF